MEKNYFSPTTVAGRMHQFGAWLWYRGSLPRVVSARTPLAFGPVTPSTIDAGSVLIVMHW